MDLVPDGEHLDIEDYSKREGFIDLREVKFVHANPEWVAYAVKLAIHQHGLTIEDDYKFQSGVFLNEELYMALTHGLGRVSILQGPSLSTEVFQEDLTPGLTRVSPRAWYDLINKAIAQALAEQLPELEEIDWADPQHVFDP